MKSNTAIIREIIKYLRSLTEDDFRDSYLCGLVGEKVASMGAKRLGSGCYSEVYSVGKFAIKIGNDQFNKLRTARGSKVFRRFAPTVYWINVSGHACVCERVEINRKHNGYCDVVYCRIRKMMEKAGFRAYDLHNDNLVRVGNTWRVVDYGCWIGNGRLND